MEAHRVAAAVATFVLAAAELTLLGYAVYRLLAGGAGAARKPTRVYADGVFDLFHPGHLAFLAKARAAGGPGAELVVGVVSDADAGWKRTPVMTQAERAAMVAAALAALGGGRVLTDAPLVLTAEFLDREGIGLVVHGDDARQEAFFAEPIRRNAMVYVPYTPGVSTSDLIRRACARAPPRRDPPPSPTDDVFGE